MDSNPPVLPIRPPMPPEIQAVLTHVSEVNKLAGSLLNVVGGSATTPGITPQEFKERMNTEYVQNLIILAERELVLVRYTIDAIPDAPLA